MSTVDSVALLSDVHGVLPVLEAVLEERDVRSADLVVVTGDHAAGPMPVETLDMLTGLGDRVVLVRGNADRELVDVARGGRSEHLESQWAGQQLRPDHIELLAELPHPVTLELAGFGTAVFCHGTPRDDEEVVLVDTRLERWAEALAGLPPEVALVGCGHTHMPFVRLVDRRIVVNPGSIGMPYGRAGGAWALLRDGQVSLRHTPIELDATCARIEAESTYPDRAAWAAEYVRSANSDADAIVAFGPRDGRKG